MSNVSQQFQPVRSVGQFETIGNDGPLPYMWNIAGPLGTLQGELHFHVFDMCRHHQIMYGDLNQRIALLDAECANYTKMLDAERENVTDDNREAFMVHESRIKDSFLNRDMEIARVKHFTDEYTVIGLWATAERFVGKVFAHIESLQSGGDVASVSRPYRWDDFKTAYTNKSIDLTALNGYTDADECRVLNNTIKHAEVVNQRLAQYPYFTPFQGKLLANIDFEMQRYVTGVFNFVGSLIESGNRLLDPNFDY